MLIKVWDTEDVTRGCLATLRGHTDEVSFLYLLSAIESDFLNSSYSFIRFMPFVQLVQHCLQLVQTSLFVPGT